MKNAGEALAADSRRLLAAIRSGGEDATLPELLRSRAERLREFTAAREAGEPVTPAQIQELERLDRELLSAVTHRRDAALAALAALRRRQTARSAYYRAAKLVPRFVDRSG